jgi:hypothetical protein
LIQNSLLMLWFLPLWCFIMFAIYKTIANSRA